MKLYWILGVALLKVLESTSAGFLATLTKSHGPLYDGVKLLIADEKFNAELIWNETSYRIKESAQMLHDGIQHLHEYKSSIEHFLQMFGTVGEMKNELGPCYKQYERDIAHLNRNILRKYNDCRETLESAASYLVNETRNEIELIRNAANEIENVSHICSIRHLKRVDQANDAGVTLCVVARIGQIDQRLMEASHFCFDVLADISSMKMYGSVSDDSEDDSDSDNDGCDSFIELKNQLEDVKIKFVTCVNGF